ncbi:PDR/VanB family oxidoreductase [Nocardia jinanensis]|uniref:Oxidoreductase n=1 Tax=Nocardia jinanensis TaxID=382504 RepID=A0A917RV57_9NOCA|nr:PDR/VanB family oxidoreductase [Nocardia jinanensis]GGL35622.1 putative oxidoreductase [Nocardia jinanensis]
MTAPDFVPPRPLRALGAVVDAYRSIFVSGPAAPLLSRPNPVRRDGFGLRLVVDSIRDEADEVLGFDLRAAGGGPLPIWRPGAHLDLFLPSGRHRQYSLCGNPRERFRYRIAVRRIADGAGGSLELHRDIRPGDALRARGPRNAFTFVEAPAYLFVAGGIGITPILPMVRAAGGRGRLVYTGRSRATMPFVADLPGADIRPDDEYGPPDIPELIATAPPGAAVYVCGPPPMLAAARRSIFEHNPTGSLHTEQFSAPAVLDGKEFDLTLARTGRTLRVGARETALAAIGRAVPDAAYSCRQGFCGTCRTAVLAGEVDHRDRALADTERATHMLPCVSRAAGDTLVLDL